MGVMIMSKELNKELRNKIIESMFDLKGYSEQLEIRLRNMPGKELYRFYQRIREDLFAKYEPWGAAIT